MDYEEARKRVTAIVAAYNEAPRIGAVLDVLTTYKGFREIIVVDDGSSDGTGNVIQKYDVTYVRNEVNIGKGHSMDKAVKMMKGDIIFFCDADVRGLNHKVLDETIEPVLSGRVDMFIAMRNRKIYYLRIVLAFVPLLGGERALKKELWEKTPDWYKDHFQIEAGLNFYAKYYGKGLGYKAFRGLTQTVKEKKQGLVTGFKNRIKMFYEVFSAQWHLELTAVPETVKSGRLALLGVIGSSFGFLIGFTIFIMALNGPAQYAYQAFTTDLARGSQSGFINFLLSSANNISINTILVLGAIIIIANLIAMLLGIRKVRYLLGPRPFRRRLK